MRKSKLVTALQTCSEVELSAFRRFVASPYFNERPELIRLLDHLLEYFPSFDFPSSVKERVFRAVFPGEPFQDKTLRYLMSDLTQLVERFWIVEKQLGQDRKQDITLLEELSERGLYKAYRQVNRRLDKKLAEKQLRDVSFFQHNLQWFEVRERHFQRERQRRFDDNVQRAAEYLDRYYFLQRLRFACAMLDRQTIIQGDYELSLSEGWIDHLRQQDFFDESIIRLYYTILQALLNENEQAHFRALKERLREVAPGMPPADLRDIHLFAINYCARKIRKGQGEYAQEALQLYRAGIEGGWLVENGRLSPWTFTNVVKLALQLRHYEWIETFIPGYAPLLPEGFRENALHYNLAELYYYTNRFEKAQEQLNQVAYSDLNYYLGARVLLSKIYYELGEEEPLLSLLAAFIIFLKRNKQVSGDLKETYLNFCNTLNQLVRRNPRRLSRLGEDIQTTKLLTDRHWLQEMYNRLV